MKTFTPLRYPGGKTKLYNQIYSLLENNNLLDGSYVEPYAGGAGLAMKLLLRNDVQRIYINDYDRSIYAFWKTALDNTDALCERIITTSVTIDEWHKQKSIQNNKEHENLFDLGFSTFFLNRTNRSGIIKGGVIGGQKQSGDYKIDCRLNKKNLVATIERIAENRGRINLQNMDAISFLEEIKHEVPGNTLFYLDPPYYSKGPGLYTNFYVHENHKKLSEFMSVNRDLNWIITYDSCDEIKELYHNFDTKEFDISYTAQDKRKGSEILIYNNLILEGEF